MNWGNKLVLAFIVFAAGMAFLVYSALQTDFEMVDEEYYKSELKYQQVIDASQRANGLIDQLKLTDTVQRIRLQMPAGMRGKNVQGDVYFYCAYDKKSDRQFPLTVDESGAQYFAKEKLAKAKYTVKVSWKYEGVSYFKEMVIRVV